MNINYAGPLMKSVQAGVRRADEFNEADHPRDEAGKFSDGGGVEEGKYGGIFTKEKLEAPADFMSAKASQAPLKLLPDHDAKTVILTHNGTQLGSAEHVNGKWQATPYSHNVREKHLEILNRAAPRGLRDIEPKEYTSSGERKGQASLF